MHNKQKTKNVIQRFAKVQEVNGVTQKALLQHMKNDDAYDWWTRKRLRDRYEGNLAYSTISSSISKLVKKDCLQVKVKKELRRVEYLNQADREVEKEIQFFKPHNEVMKDENEG